jgi:hypothetical protein
MDISKVLEGYRDPDWGGGFREMGLFPKIGLEVLRGVQVYALVYGSILCGVRTASRSPS